MSSRSVGVRLHNGYIMYYFYVLLLYIVSLLLLYILYTLPNFESAELQALIGETYPDTQLPTAARSQSHCQSFVSCLISRVVCFLVGSGCVTPVV